MDTKLIQEVTDWLRTTDLAEFCYEKNGDSLEIKTREALPEPARFPCSLTPVCSPAIGIYHVAEKGKNGPFADGQKSAEGAPLGLVETASETHFITAPHAGKLHVAAAEDGTAVEYGQPLFFIEKAEPVA